MATHQKKHVKIRGTKELLTKEKGEEYGEVVDIEGGCRFKCQLLNTNTVLAKLAGRLIKGPNKQMIGKGDFVLLQLDTVTTEKDNYYIIHRYSPEDKKKLMKQGELTQIKNLNETGTNVVMQGDVINNTITEVDVDDVFIDNI